MAEIIPFPDHNPEPISPVVLWLHIERSRREAANMYGLIADGHVDEQVGIAAIQQLSANLGTLFLLSDAYRGN